MKKIRLIRLFIATSLLVLCSCEDNFDPKIFGTLNPDNFPSTETEYKDYALACYLPFTTTWTYYIGTELRQHGFIYRKAAFSECLSLLRTIWLSGARAGESG